MRWVFYSLLILNLVYLVWSLVDLGTSSVEPVQSYQPESSAPRELTLLDEAQAGEPAANRSSAPGERQRLCPVVGPFDTRGDGEQALKALTEAGYQGRVRNIQVEKERLHWVYLPPLDSRDEALQTLRELQSRGVDSFVVSEGEDRNAISLGYFQSEDSARGLRSKMNTAGYPAEIRETAEEVTEYWVYVDSRSVDDDGRALRQFLQAREGVEADHSSCDGAAPNIRR
jgi:cell division septation protein DedD